MKLNIACGRDVKEGFINIDSVERENKLDMILDVTKEFPFEKESCEYIYAEQFIEHLNWLEGWKFLMKCYNILEPNGILRLVLPDYKKIFQKYLERDYQFFDVFFKGLNEGDLPYYCSVYQNPEKVRKERQSNPPPEWHLSPKQKDRRRLELRCRTYRFLIDIVDWFVHQYFEHKTLWDFESLRSHLLEMGFSEVNKTKIKDIDSHAPTRITSSLYIEATK
jgi:predicted SAM-dependent methyltransferase